MLMRRVLSSCEEREAAGGASSPCRHPPRKCSRCRARHRARPPERRAARLPISAVAKIMQRPPGRPRAAWCKRWRLTSEVLGSTRSMALTSREAARSPAAPAAPERENREDADEHVVTRRRQPRPTTHGPLHGAGEFSRPSRAARQSRRRPCRRIRPRPAFAPHAPPWRVGRRGPSRVAPSAWAPSAMRSGNRGSSVR